MAQKGRAGILGQHTAAVIGDADEGHATVLDLHGDLGRTGIHRIFKELLDNRGGLIESRVLQEGSVNSANVNVRRVTEIALRGKASSVVIAHNHPSGVAAPSKEDVATTQTIINALKAIGIAVSDHIILCDSEAYAMSAKERLADMFT